MIRLRLLFFICGSLFYLSTVCAQVSTNQNVIWTITLYNHSIGLPFKTFFKKPLNIGLTLGAEIPYGQQHQPDWYQKIELGFHHHKHLQKAILLKTDLVRRFYGSDGLQGDVQIGIGGLYDIPVRQTFKQDELGNYQTKGINGQFDWIGGFGLAGGYEKRVNDEMSFRPILRYESFIQFPYSNFTGILPHTLIHVGNGFNFK